MWKESSLDGVDLVSAGRALATNSVLGLLGWWRLVAGAGASARLGLGWRGRRTHDRLGARRKTSSIVATATHCDEVR